MSQVQRVIVAQPTPFKRQNRQATAAAALIVAAAIAGTLFLTSIKPNAVPTVTRQQTDAVDGWMPGIASTQAARLERMQDGYLPGLLAARGSGDAVDGYLPGLLAARGSGDAVDGWESGLMH